MKPIIAILALLLLPAFALAQQPVPKPAGPGGSCPHGYTASGSFCVPSQGAQVQLRCRPTDAARNTR